LALAIAACQEEYENELNPWKQNFLGNGMLKLSVDGMRSSWSRKNQQPIIHAAADGSEIWVDDLEHIWPVKAKIPASPGSNSFAGMGDNIVAPIYSYDTADIAEPYDSITETFEGYHTMDVLEGK
jgi:hypothetical protein